MQIETNYRGVEKTDALEARIQDEVGRALDRFAQRLTRIEVHVGDENASKGGPDDKRCLMEARPRGADPLVAEARGADMYAVIAQAAERLERVLEKKFRVD